MKRVVVTGMAGLTPLGNDWPTIFSRLKSERNAIVRMADWEDYEGLNTRLGAPAAAFELPGHYNRKTTRSMGRVAILATRAAEMALEQAGLRDDPVIRSGRVGIAFGSSSGTPRAVGDFGHMLNHRSTQGISATTYVRMMAHTAPVNLGVFLGLTGRIITTSSACTSGSQGIGYAFEAVRHGLQTAMVAGGADELCATEAAVFDTLFATSTRNDTPQLTPRPYDAERDGLVIGEGAGALVLEELDHALARGATIHAEIVGFGTNSDGCHVTQPQVSTMQIAMEQALQQAGLPPSAIGYVNGHGTATEQGDIAETLASQAAYGAGIPISSLKSYLGHTLGACGAIEAWITLEMQRAGWFAPTLNLERIDPRCGDLDYILSGGRHLDCEYVASNNFAFGGINTSLIFRRWST